MLIYNLTMLKQYCQFFGPRGLYLAGRTKMLRQPVAFQASTPLAKHPVTLRLKSSDVPTFGQVFFKQEYRFHVARTPRTIVDAGANIGLASVYFANVFPEARVIAIEPERSNFTLLQRNATPYPNITPIHAALWNENTEINLVDPGLGNWAFRTERAGTGDGATVRHTVRALTIDRLMDELDLDYIDILKIDIEGAEKEVFQDPSRWIERIGVLIVELHDRYKAGCNRSFYNATNNFEVEWYRGENAYLAHPEWVPVAPE